MNTHTLSLPQAGRSNLSLPQVGRLNLSLPQAGRLNCGDWWGRATG